MRTSLYYFTGTGNSLYIARKIASGIEDCKLLPVTDFTEQTLVRPESEKVGLVFPLYYWGMPVIIREFMEKTDFSRVRYIFTVATAMMADGLAIAQVAELLQTKGAFLNAGFYVKMPGNYLLWFNPPSAEKQNRLLKKAENKILHITSLITGNKNHKDRERPLYQIVTNARRSYSRWRKNFKKNDRGFHVLREKCTSCSICIKVCPVNNISMKEGAPLWNHRNCQKCLACIHTCPSKAIQCGNNTQKKRRYRNPEISLKELLRK